ncbi:MAG: hypothetical protein JWR80_9439 [Bradyrhizobium sp.]|nr:hypothetical protein [Bradyrhizobium sp.]
MLGARNRGTTSLMLIEEFTHRVLNEYSRAIAGLRLAARYVHDAKARHSLIEAADHLHAQAHAHRALATQRILAPLGKGPGRLPGPKPVVVVSRCPLSPRAGLYCALVCIVSQEQQNATVPLGALCPFGLGSSGAASERGGQPKRVAGNGSHNSRTEIAMIQNGRAARGAGGSVDEPRGAAARTLT